MVSQRNLSIRDTNTQMPRSFLLHCELRCWVQIPSRKKIIKNCGFVSIIKQPWLLEEKAMFTFYDDQTARLRIHIRQGNDKEDTVNSVCQPIVFFCQSSLLLPVWFSTQLFLITACLSDSLLTPHDIFFNGKFRRVLCLTTVLCIHKQSSYMYLKDNNANYPHDTDRQIISIMSLTSSG